MGLGVIELWALISRDELLVMSMCFDILTKGRGEVTNNGYVHNI